MTRLPRIVIVGRPNVGKSSLLNWIAGKRLAIVDDFEGVTRDRVSFVLPIRDRYVELYDTGGVGIVDSDQLSDHVEEQIRLAMDEADVLLFTLDARAGIFPLDEEVARRLRELNKPTILVASKVDDRKYDPQAEEFRRLMNAPLVVTSAHQGRGKDELFDLIAELLPPKEKVEETTGAALSEPEMKLAIVGRRNVGKSTFINTLLDEKRMIVSEVPGTTRDSVDVRFLFDGKPILAIDTPGVKKKKSVASDLEFYSAHRAERSVRRCDVALMFFDAEQTISKVDKQLCNYVETHYKPCILVVNKWDLLHGKVATQEWADYLRQTFPSLAYMPIAFITGMTGKNVKTLLAHARMLFKQARTRIGTGELNRAIKAALQRNPPPLHGVKTPKVYYATQIAEAPPTIVLMCNDDEAFAPSYRRYLMNQLRDVLPFGEVPVRLFFEKRSERSKSRVAAAAEEEMAKASAAEDVVEEEAPQPFDENDLGGGDFDGDDFIEGFDDLDADAYEAEASPDEGERME